MQLVPQDKIDRKRWDQLVASTKEATFYNASRVLDALAENWSVLIIGDYEGGMAVPFSVRLGVKGIYTPNFVRSLNWLGKQPEDFSAVEALLRQEFKRCHLRT